MKQARDTGLREVRIPWIMLQVPAGEKVLPNYEMVLATEKGIGGVHWEHVLFEERVGYQPGHD